MASRNNTTLVFHHPVPKAARKRLQAIIEEDFRDDWDGEQVWLDDLEPGRQVLFGRDVSYDIREELIGMARQHSFSLITHCEDHGADEPDNTIWAYNAKTFRELQHVDARPGNFNEPLVPLSDALGLTHEELRYKYGLPEELLDTWAESKARACQKS